MLPIKRQLLSIFLFSSAFAPSALSQTGTFTSMSMASYGPLVSPDSIAAGFGMNLGSGNTAGSLPLQTTLAGTSVAITDSSGAKLAAPLYLVSPGQINYLIPATAKLGRANVAVTTASGMSQGSLLISNIAPAIVTASSDGKGVPAAQIFRLTAAGVTSLLPAFMGATGSYTAAPINLSTASDQVYLMLYGTGVRRHSLNPIFATLGGIRIPVQYAGPQSQYPGLDQINVGPLPQTLVGKGAVNLVLTVDGIPANTVALNIQ